MKKILFILLVIMFCRSASFSQCTPAGSGLTATVISSPASCPLSGSIAISVAGSSGGAPYSFSLSGTCLASPLNQSQANPNYTFTSLQGNCTYSICISDAGGNIISRTATVGDTYTVLSGLLITESIRISNVQFTVVQKLNHCSSRNRGVIDCGAPFLFLFWRNKKEKKIMQFI